MKLKYKLKEYIEVIKSINIGNIKLSVEQFKYLKELCLKDGFIIGMHNTGVENLDSFFEIGLYNNRDYFFKKTCDLTNTVAYSSVC